MLRGFIMLFALLGIAVSGIALLVVSTTMFQLGVSFIAMILSLILGLFAVGDMQ